MIIRTILIGCCLLPLVTHATDEPRSWKGEGAFGFTSTSGNTESETLTANLGISRQSNDWKHIGGLKIIRAETDKQQSADSLELTARSEYTLSDKSYLFVKLRHEDDEFSGFEYQNSIAFGVGSRLIADEKQLLDVSAGLGTRSLKVEATGQTEKDGVVIADLIYIYNISTTSKFGQTFSIEEGDENTHTESETSLTLQIEGNLSAKLAYLVKRNSEVPDSTEKTDKITTISLVYGF